MTVEQDVETRLAALVTAQARQGGIVPLHTEPIDRAAHFLASVEGSRSIVVMGSHNTITINVRTAVPDA